MLSKNIFFSFIICLFVISCSNDKSPSNEALDQIVVHLDKEPQRLNPILQTISEERIVTEHMFLSLCDFDPITGEWVPVLATEIPQVVKSKDENGEAISTVSVEIVPEAIWENESPITGYDFEVTMKLASLPSVNSPSWKSALGDLWDIRVDPDNAKRFTFIISGDYFRSVDAILSAELLPRHIYDPANSLGAYSYRDIKSKSTEEVVDSVLMAVGTEFSSAKYSRDSIIEGAGAYKLKQWRTDQFIVLDRKSNWWGSAYPERTLLAANPNRIVYQVINDPTVALTQIRNGQIDVMSLESSAAQVFLDLKQDSSIASRYDFYNPQLPRIYYILLNNQDKRLSDVNVRRALAHCMDVDRLIAQQEKGLGQRVNGPLSPQQPGYLTTTEPISYDISKAKELLAESGWADIDGDGVLELDGEALNLRFFISGSPLSTAVSTLLQEAAANAGFNIELVTKSSRASRQENFIPGDFELTAYAITSEGKSDPYLRFHTDAMGKNGLNWGGYSSPAVDELLNTIRYSASEEGRMKAYEEFQQLIYDDQPMIFLYAPVEKFVVSKKFNPVISSKRPGYFVNAFSVN